MKSLTNPPPPKKKKTPIKLEITCEIHVVITHWWSIYKDTISEPNMYNKAKTVNQPAWLWQDRCVGRRGCSSWEAYPCSISCVNHAPMNMRDKLYALYQGCDLTKVKKSWKMGGGPGSPFGREDKAPWTSWMFNFGGFTDSPHTHKQETRGLDTI